MAGHVYEPLSAKVILDERRNQTISKLQHLMFG